MVISQFAKPFPGNTDQLPRAEKIMSMAYDQIEAALWFGAPKLAWLRYYLWNTLTAKKKATMVIWWLYLPLTQWLIE